MTADVIRMFSTSFIKSEDRFLGSGGGSFSEFAVASLLSSELVPVV